MIGEFVKVLKSVGQLALQTLKTNNPLLQYSEVKRIVGDHAFEYGFFAGHENVKPCTDPTAGICVIYAHRSIKEFFGSFGFLQALDDGKSVDDILGSDCEKPIFMMNPLVLQFCLWLLTTKYFGSRRIVYEKLVACAAQRIDMLVFDIDLVDEIYPAMGIRKALHDGDRLKLEFSKHVFEKCEQVRVFQIRRDQASSRDRSNEGHQAFDTYVLGVLELISHGLLNKLSLLSITDSSIPRAAQPDVNSHALTVSIELYELIPYKLIPKIPVWLTKYGTLKKDFQVCASIYSTSPLDLKDLVQKHIKQLHVSRYISKSQETLSASGEFPFCPHFTHFSTENFHIDDSVPAAFMKAVTDGKLPNLKRIELGYCTMNECEWPEVPEFSLETETMSDSSQMQKLLLKLTELIVREIEEPLHIDHLIPVRSENLSVLRLYLDPTKLQCLNDVMKQGFLPNLSELVLEAHRSIG